MTLRHLRRRASGTSRRVLPATALLVLAGGLAACSDDDPAELSAPEASSESPAEPSDEADTEQPSEPEESEPEERITPPGAQLDFDETALVNLPYSILDNTSGVFRISLDAIETAPLERLDRANYPRPSVPLDLYLVRQTFEMVERGNDNPGRASVIGHTQMVDADGVEAEFVNANVPGCEFDPFQSIDKPGQQRKACNAFLVPRSSPPVSVTYFTTTKRYDALQGGDFIYWPVEGVTAS